MAITGSVGNVAADEIYASSFGALPAGTCYYEGGRGSMIGGEFKSADMRSELKSKFEVGLKALSTTTGGAGTAGYAMVPIYVDPRIVDRTRKYTPLVEIIPRVTNMGMYADYNVITAKGGGVTAAEDAALSETSTTYDRISVAIKFLYAIGRVTGPAQAAVPSYMLAGFQPGSGATGAFGDQSAPNAMQNEVLVKSRELRELEENLIVNGDASSDATQFSGFVKLLGTTNQLDKSSTALSLDDIQTAVQYAFDDGGRPNLAVADSATYTDLLKLLTAKIGYMSPTQQVFWGFSTIVLNTMVGQVPVIPSMYATNTANAKTLYFLDLSVIEMRVLQDMTFEELAKTNDSRKFMLKIYECMIIRAPTFCSFVDNIA